MLTVSWLFTTFDSAVSHLNFIVSKDYQYTWMSLRQWKLCLLLKKTFKKFCTSPFCTEIAQYHSNKEPSLQCPCSHSMKNTTPSYIATRLCYFRQRANILQSKEVWCFYLHNLQHFVNNVITWRQQSITFSASTTCKHFRLFFRLLWVHCG